MNIGVVAGSTEILTIAQNSTKFSQTIMRFSKCAGFAGMLLTISAGSISINQQCGFNDSGLFYSPVDKFQNNIGVVCSLFSAGTYWIQYDPVIAPFSRFRVVEANVASTTVTLTPLFLEDR